MEEEDNNGWGGTSGTARGTATRKDGNNKEDSEDSEDGKDNKRDGGDDIGDGDKDNSLRTIFPGAHSPRFVSAHGEVVFNPPF